MGEFGTGPDVAMEVLPEQYSWITGFTKIDKGDIPDIIYNDKKVTARGLYVDENFFSIFNFDFLSGDPLKALQNQHTIVLTKELAHSLFGDEEPIGQIVEMGKDKTPYTVTGVMEIGRMKSHVNSEFYARAEPPVTPNPNWLSVASFLYIKVADEVSLDQVQEALDKLVEENVYPKLGSTLDFQSWLKRDDSFRFIAQPLDDIYLKGIKRFDLVAGGNATTVYVLLGIAIFILLIASINFINLTTARADKRAKEVGVKKVFGSSRATLIIQFLTESVLSSLVSVIIGLGLSELILMFFQYILGRNVMGSVFDNPVNLVFALAIGLIIGILSGVYPAFILSSFKPARVIKNHLRQNRTFNFRNILVVFQFTLSLTLISCVLIMYNQLSFMKKKDLGFDQENVLLMDNAHLLGDKLTTFKQSLEDLSYVQSVTDASRFPGSTTSFSVTSYRKSDEEEPQNINRYRGDEHFLETLGFTLVEGKNFNGNLASDSNSVILNQAAVKSLDLKNPVGSLLNNGSAKVIGVVHDFNFETLRKEIAPLAITFNDKYSFHRLAIKFKMGQSQNLINYVNELWTKYNVEDPLRFHFLDENFAQLMEKDKEMGKIVTLFTGLAIIISCLGLFGLASYMALLRRKEIGIRKVLGASVSGIVSLLNTEFSKLVLASAILASPIAGFVMSKWLSNFAFRIEISFWYYLVSAIIALLIAWITVSWQSIRAAFANPVNSLREE